jgi:hypothetical protein
MWRSMNRYAGLIIAFVTLTLMALFIHQSIPYPSSYIFILLMSNGVVAFISIFTQTLVIRIYELNVFEGKKRFIDDCFRYLVIGMTGINYYVQLLFRSFPYLINKMLAVTFTLALLWMFFGVIAIFD